MLGVEVDVAIKVFQWLELQTGPGPVDFAGFSQPGDHAFDDIDRYGETEVAANDGAARVDADDFSSSVDQRAAGVAGADRRVGLEPGTVFAALGQVAIGAGYDADRDGAGQTPGSTHRHHEITFFERCGVTHSGDIQRFIIAFHIEFQECNVQVFVTTQNLGRLYTPVLQKAADFEGFFDDVPVGKYFTFFRDNDTTARTL